MGTESVVKRLSNLIERRYGHPIQFMDLTRKRVPVHVNERVSLVRRNQGAKVIVAGEDLLFPISDDSHLLGYTEIYGAAGLESRQIDQIGTMVDLILKEFLVLKHRDETLEHLEDYLRTHLNEDRRHPMGELRTANPDLRQSIEIGSRQAEQNTPVLVLCHTGSAALELAKEIHSRSSKKDFINLEDVDKGKLRVTQDLKNLGAVTLFIPEVANLTPELQLILQTLLRNEHLNPHAPRVIAATSGQPKELVEKGWVRRELMYRLSTARIKMPKMEERREDILDLLHFFLQAHSKGQDLQSFFGPETLKYLSEYCWPGNEKELETETKRLVAGTRIRPVPVDRLHAKIVGVTTKRLFELIRTQSKLSDATKSLESDLIGKSLKDHDGNKSKVSRELGLSRSALHQKIQELDL